MSNSCKYYTERTLGWMLNNKVIVLLSLLSFSLFVSTLAIAGQRNRLANELHDLTSTVAPTTTLVPTQAPPQGESGTGGDSGNQAPPQGESGTGGDSGNQTPVGGESGTGTGDSGNQTPVEGESGTGTGDSGNQAPADKQSSAGTRSSGNQIFESKLLQLLSSAQ